MFKTKTFTSTVNINDPDHPKFHYVSTQTGELLCNLSDVIITTIRDLIKYRFINAWKYSKEGF